MILSRRRHPLVVVAALRRRFVVVFVVACIGAVVVDVLPYCFVKNQNISFQKGIYFTNGFDAMVSSAPG